MNVVVQLLRGEVEAVPLLQAGDHAAEVLADELDDEFWAREGLVELDALGGADLVDELGAALEGELLREDERVVAVEEEGSDLLGGESG